MLACIDLSVSLSLLLTDGRETVHVYQKRVADYMCTTGRRPGWLAWLDALPSLPPHLHFCKQLFCLWQHNFQLDTRDLSLSPQWRWTGPGQTLDHTNVQLTGVGSFYQMYNLTVNWYSRFGPLHVHVEPLPSYFCRGIFYQTFTLLTNADQLWQLLQICNNNFK